ncbi:hypothetical protein PanWU01x14_365870 [Parasponia andersonii]|uniref:Uncharacterized protein n=1 Tax=Parasponia andersonii TaxID=3476 RepID=A0A2P5A5X2_PARAD|nr:hypothetical protein PanWU01x14_365870 [Parasponia andersonii]
MLPSRKMEALHVPPPTLPTPPIRFVTGCKEDDILEIVRDILKHISFGLMDKSESNPFNKRVRGFNSNLT